MAPLMRSAGRIQIIFICAENFSPQEKYHSLHAITYISEIIEIMESIEISEFTPWITLNFKKPKQEIEENSIKNKCLKLFINTNFENKFHTVCKKFKNCMQITPYRRKIQSSKIKSAVFRKIFTA